MVNALSSRSVPSPQYGYRYCNDTIAHAAIVVLRTGANGYQRVQRLNPS